MTVWFHPEAEAEHLETVVYYETRRAGLGALYLAAFEQALETVRDNPHRYRIVNEPDIRRVPLARFPFSIIYRGKRENRDTRRGPSQAQAGSGSLDPDTVRHRRSREARQNLTLMSRASSHV